MKIFLKGQQTEKINFDRFSFNEKIFILILTLMFIFLFFYLSLSNIGILIKHFNII